MYKLELAKEAIGDLVIDESHLEDNAIQILNVKDYVKLFVNSIIKLYIERKDLIGSMTFNKDDDLIIDFVTAATNLRAFNFSIPMEVMISFVLIGCRVSSKSRKWLERSFPQFQALMHWWLRSKSSK